MIDELTGLERVDAEGDLASGLRAGADVPVEYLSDTEVADDPPI